MSLLILGYILLYVCLHCCIYRDPDPEVQAWLELEAEEASYMSSEERERKFVEVLTLFALLVQKHKY